MNQTKTPRIVALVASIATTFLIVHALASYGYPAPDSTVVVAQAASGASR